MGRLDRGYTAADSSPPLCTAMPCARVAAAPGIAYEAIGQIIIVRPPAIACSCERAMAFYLSGCRTCARDHHFIVAKGGNGSSAQRDIPVDDRHQARTPWRRQDTGRKDLFRLGGGEAIRWHSPAESWWYGVSMARGYRTRGKNGGSR